MCLPWSRRLSSSRMIARRSRRASVRSRIVFCISPRISANAHESTGSLNPEALSDRRFACRRSEGQAKCVPYNIAYQRELRSDCNCRFASSQSDSASPGSANLRRRSEMKYARKRIWSSDGSAGAAASGGIEILSCRGLAVFLPRDADFLELVAARRGRGALAGFTSGVDPSASVGT